MTGSLFFALWPDASVRDALAAIGRDRVPPGARTHHPADLHVTLVFLGPVEPARMDCIDEVAREISGEPFKLTLDSIGYWRRPRILWCGPSHTPAALARLVDDLQTGLAGCGFEPERRAYSPHVTLARKSPLRPAEVLPRPVSWQVNDFVLATSGGGSHVPRYRVLKKWRLDS